MYGKRLSGKRPVRESECPGNVLSGKRQSGKVIVRETSVTQLAVPDVVGVVVGSSVDVVVVITVKNTQTHTHTHAYISDGSEGQRVGVIDCSAR